MALSVEELIKDYSVRLDGLKTAIKNKATEAKSAAKAAKAKNIRPFEYIDYVTSIEELFALSGRVLDINEFIQHLKNRRW